MPMVPGAFPAWVDLEWEARHHSSRNPVQAQPEMLEELVAVLYGCCADGYRYEQARLDPGHLPREVPTTDEQEMAYRNQRQSRPDRPDTPRHHEAHPSAYRTHSG